ncbi:MAG: hypothetical protein WCK33_02450 [Phycisphaerae bacterium]
MKATAGLGLTLLGAVGIVAGLWLAASPVVALYREALDAPLESNATGDGIAAAMAPGLALGACGAVTYVIGLVVRRIARVRRRP